MRRPRAQLAIRNCEIVLMKWIGIHDGIICTGQGLLYSLIYGSVATGVENTRQFHKEYMSCTHAAISYSLYLVQS
jgi:hypothetical protein